MSVTRKTKAAKAATCQALNSAPSPKAQLKASIDEHGFITAKARGYLVACEQEVVTDLTSKIEMAIDPLSEWFVRDLEGVSGALYHLGQSLNGETDQALVSWCIRVLNAHAKTIAAVRENCEAAIRVAHHPEWHSGSEPTRVAGGRKL